MSYRCTTPSCSKLAVRHAVALCASCWGALPKQLQRRLEKAELKASSEKGRKQQEARKRLSRALADAHAAVFLRALARRVSLRIAGPRATLWVNRRHSYDLEARMIAKALASCAQALGLCSPKGTPLSGYRSVRDPVNGLPSFRLPADLPFGAPASVFELATAGFRGAATECGWLFDVAEVTPARAWTGSEAQLSELFAEAG